MADEFVTVPPTAPKTPEEEALYAQSLEGKTLLDMPLPDDESEQGEAVSAPEILDPVITDEDLSVEVMPLVEGVVRPFEDAGNPISLTPGQLIGTADMVNGLGIGSRYASMEEMRRAFSDEITGSSLDEAIGALQASEGPERRQRAMAILNRTDLAPEARIALVADLERSARIPDANIVERKALALEAEAEYAGDYSDDGEIAYINSLEAISTMPKLPTVATTDREVTGDELKRAFEEYVTLMVQEADSNAGLLSLAPNFLPFYNAIPVQRIMRRMNEMMPEGKKLMSTGTAAMLNGTALRAMREEIETWPTEKKVQFLGRILPILKGEGALHTENAHVTLHTLQQLFHRDLFGEDAIKMAPKESQVAFLTALNEADRAARHAAAEKDPTRKAALEKAEKDWLREAMIVDAQADGRMWDESNDVTLSQWLDDLAVLDFAMFGPLLKGTIKGGGKAPGMSYLRRKLKIAPDNTTKAAVEALSDPAVRAKMGNLMGEEIAETFLPAALKDAVEAGVNGMGELMARADRVQKDLIRARREGSGLAAQQRRAFEDELRKISGDWGGAGTAIHVDKSAYTHSDLGVDVVARYGRSPSKGFSTLAAARKAADNAPVSDVKLVEEVGGKFVPVDPSRKSGKGQFFLEVQDSRTYDSSMSVWESAVLDRKTVRDPWFLPSNLVSLPKLFNWFMPTGSMFGKEVASEIGHTAMMAGVVQRQQQNLVRNLAGLGSKEQALVSNLIKTGEEQGRIWRASEMRSQYRGISDQAITAYYEARLLADNMFSLANTQQRTEWLRNGVKRIAHNKTGHVGYGKLLDNADDAVNDIRPGFDRLHAYNPETGEFVKLSRADIDAAYRRGETIARMEDLIEGPKFKEATHVLMNRNTLVKELPHQVLDKVPGYYPHIFQGNYVIYGISKAGNRVALSLSKTVGDARAEKARLEREFARMAQKEGESPYDAIDFQFDRSLRDPLVQSRDAADPIFGATNKVYGKRTGRMLENASKAHGDHMVDPIEALLRGMELVSHSITKGNLVKHMEQRLLNTLKLMEKESGKKIIRDPKRMPTKAEDIAYHSDIAKDHRKVLAYQQQIDMIRHIPDAVERHMAVALATAEHLLDTVAQKIGGRAGKMLDNIGGALIERAAKGADPMRLLTEYSHRVYIAANPMQQFALQFSQVLMLSGVAPRDLPRAMSRTLPVHALLMARIMRNSPETSNFSGAAAQAFYDKMRTHFSKLSGMDEAEMEKLVGVLERSGLVDSVAMHSQMRTTIRSQATSRMLASASALNRNPVKRVTMDVLMKADEATFGNLSKVGFEAGEQYNRVATFLTLYGRDSRKGIANLSDSEYIRKIVGEVNELTGSMLRETGMGYQRGWLKAAFQFVAFQHKMAAMMLTSQYFTPAQKVGMTLSQFLLFGSRGAFHLDAAQRQFESWAIDHEAEEGEKNALLQWYWSPQGQALIDGVVFDAGVNQLIRVVYGDDAPGFAWNRRIAPGGGSEMMAQALIELANNPVDKVFGLAKDHGSKVVDFLNHVRQVTLAQAQDMDDVPLGERIGMLVKEGGALAFSGLDKYFASAAAESMGGWVSDTGNILDASDYGIEFALATILGVNTEDREAYYEAVDKLNRETRNDPERHKEALKSIADSMFRRMIDEQVKYASEAPTPEVYDKLTMMTYQRHALMLSFLSPREQEQVSEMIRAQVQELVANKDKGDYAQKVFVEKLMSRLKSAGFGDDEILNWDAYMENHEIFKTYPNLKLSFKAQLDEMMAANEEQ